MTENLHVDVQAGPEVEATGRRGTAMMFAIIGWVWWQVGANRLEGIAGKVLVALGIAGAVALVVISVRTLGTQGSDELFRRNRRMFNRVNLIQFVAIAAVVATCILTENPEWTMPLITIIVGVHFLPFAPAFHWQGFRWMGFAMIALGVVGCVLAATAIPMETVVTVAGLGAATVLWAAVLSLVLTGRQSVTSARA